MLRKAAVPKRICDRRRAQNAVFASIGLHVAFFGRSERLPGRFPEMFCFSEVLFLIEVSLFEYDEIKS